MHTLPFGIHELQNGIRCSKGKAAALELWDCQEGCFNCHEELQVMTPSLQNSGKFKWNLWMYCSVFLIRYLQSWKQFHKDFLTSSGALMIEEDAIDSKEIVGFPEVHHNPVGIKFCCPCKNNFEVLLYRCLAHTQFRHTHTGLCHMQGEVHISAAAECCSIWLAPCMSQILYRKKPKQSAQ